MKAKWALTLFLLVYIYIIEDVYRANCSSSRPIMARIHRFVAIFVLERTATITVPWIPAFFVSTGPSAMLVTLGISRGNPDPT
jgi:hypothetical protein